MFRIAVVVAGLSKELLNETRPEMKLLSNEKNWNNVVGSTREVLRKVRYVAG